MTLYSLVILTMCNGQICMSVADHDLTREDCGRRIIQGISKVPNGYGEYITLPKFKTYACAIQTNGGFML